MLPIKKGRAPKELEDAHRRIKGTPDTTLSWRNVTGFERNATLRALLEEQGGLCAYCMRRVGPESSHVEHIVPQSVAAGGDDPLSLDFGNLLAVCDGFEGSGEGLTCDRARGDASLTVNPLRPETLSSIRYRRDGVIGADDPTINDDVVRTLNLNQPLLVRNRREALRALFSMLDKKGKKDGSQGVVNLCRRYIDDHLSDPKKREPFDGAVIYFMRKRVRAAK